MNKMALPGRELSENSQTEMFRTRKNVEELQSQVTQLLTQVFFFVLKPLLNIYF